MRLIFAPASVRNQRESNIEPSNNPNYLPEKGIFLTSDSKFLLTEKFIRVEFLVPFPTYEFTMQLDFEHFFTAFHECWISLFYFAHFNIRCYDRNAESKVHMRRTPI